MEADEAERPLEQPLDRVGRVGGMRDMHDEFRDGGLVAQPLVLRGELYPLRLRTRVLRTVREQHHQRKPEHGEQNGGDRRDFELVPEPPNALLELHVGFGESVRQGPLCRKETSSPVLGRMARPRSNERELRQDVLPEVVAGSRNLGEDLPQFRVEALDLLDLPRPAGIRPADVVRLHVVVQECERTLDDLIQDSLGLRRAAQLFVSAREQDRRGRRGDQRDGDDGDVRDPEPAA